VLTSIFVNLPSSDIERSKSFYSALGWTINPSFTDEKSACVVIEDNVFLMILTTEFFSTFTHKPIVDPNSASQTQVAFSRDSRTAVDEMLGRVVAAGGTEFREAQDYGFMYSRDFEDPDGNWFSALWMDPVAAEQGPDAFLAAQGSPTPGPS
jgi:predicted lactoylglutathione lyase